MIHALLYKCLRTRSDWTKFQLELFKLMDVFKSNGYPENLIDNCFKMLLDNKHTIHKKMITVPKKPLIIVLHNLDIDHCKLKPRKESLSKIFSIVVNYGLCLRVKTKLANAFHFKDGKSKELHLD